MRKFYFATTLVLFCVLNIWAQPYYIPKSPVQIDKANLNPQYIELKINESNNFSSISADIEELEKNIGENNARLLKNLAQLNTSLEKFESYLVQFKSIGPFLQLSENYKHLEEYYTAELLKNIQKINMCYLAVVKTSDAENLIAGNILKTVNKKLASATLANINKNEFVALMQQKLSLKLDYTVENILVIAQKNNYALVRMSGFLSENNNAKASVQESNSLISVYLLNETTAQELTKAGINQETITKSKIANEKINATALSAIQDITSSSLKSISGIQKQSMEYSRQLKSNIKTLKTFLSDNDIGISGKTYEIMVNEGLNLIEEKMKVLNRKKIHLLDAILDIRSFTQTVDDKLVENVAKKTVDQLKIYFDNLNSTPNIIIENNKKGMTNFKQAAFNFTKLNREINQVWVYPVPISEKMHQIYLINNTTTKQKEEGVAKRKSNFFEKTDGLELEMIFVEGGKFNMGSPVTDKESQDDERPVHEVTVPAFYM